MVILLLNLDFSGYAVIPISIYWIYYTQNVFIYQFAYIIGIFVLS